MASSSNKKRKGKVVFDKEKFISEDARNRFYEFVTNRNPIVERGLCITGVHWSSIQNNIWERKWDDFCAQPLATIVPVLREFYANAPKHEHRKVFVKGRQVNFSGQAINKFVKVPNVENDEYTAFIGRQIDYQEILRVIAVPGTQWKLTDDKPVTLPS